MTETLVLSNLNWLQVDFALILPPLTGPKRVLIFKSVN